ncbi:MAG TPA: FAD-dependent monooxygenase [Longimicrobium sp.]|nr:FAD-dependent monooxygenase [Longimicrobium sp.]
MTIESKPILIAGGGIGGLAAAIALRRVGVEARVYERAPEPGEVGAGISLWPNATRQLRRWGVLDDVMRRGFVFRGGIIRNPAGAELSRIPIGEHDAPSILIHRATLHSALLAQLPPWTVHGGTALEGFVDDGAGVRARFTGLGEVEGAALIGADGLRSTVRRILLDDGEPVYRGYPVWRGVAEGEFSGANMLTETVGAGLRFGTVPIGEGRVSWWATANEPRGTDDGAEGAKAKLLRIFGGWHAPIPQLLEATPAASYLKNDTFDRPPRRGWSRGRVTLLGDAAHPTTPNMGQGGCLAIEDGAVLAAALTRAPNVAAALRDFERLRFRRVAAIVRQSLHFGRVGQLENPVAVRLRDTLLRLAPASLAERSMRPILAFDAR